MRKIIVTNIMSLDGYYEGPGRNVMALPMDAAFDAYNLERMRAADTVLLGHNSYQMFSGFWPSMADNPNASPAHNRRHKPITSHFPYYEMPPGCHPAKLSLAG